MVSLASLITAQVDSHVFFQQGDQHLSASHVAILVVRCVLTTSIFWLGIAIFWRNVQYRLLGVLLSRAPVVLLLCQLVAYFGLEMHSLAKMAKDDGDVVWIWMFVDNFATVYAWLCMIFHDVLLVTPGARRLWFLVAFGVHANGAATRVGRLLDYEQDEIFGAVRGTCSTSPLARFIPLATNADGVHLAYADDGPGRDPHLACDLFGSGFLQCGQCADVARPRVLCAREVRQRTADALRGKRPHVLSVRARAHCTPCQGTRELEVAETEPSTEHTFRGARPARAAARLRPGARR